MTTRLNLQLEYRFGWGLPMDLSKISDQPGFGMALDPVYLDPEQPVTALNNWRFYFNLVARYAWIDYLAPAEGGPTESGYNHPAVGRYPGREQALLGLHMVRVRSASTSSTTAVSTQCRSRSTGSLIG